MFSQSAVSIKNIDANMTLVPNATINVATIANGNTKVNFDITNTSNATTSYIAKRYDVLLNTSGSTQAAAYFCFAGNCYGSFITSANGLTLTPGQSASSLSGQFNILTADLDEANTVGESVVKYSFINENVPSDSVQVTIKYNQPLGVKEQSGVISAINLFPNPSTGGLVALTLNSAKALEAKMSIYNLLGNNISEKSVVLNEGKNKVEISTENLPKGVYFIHLKSEGLVSFTRRLIVK